VFHHRVAKAALRSFQTAANERLVASPTGRAQFGPVPREVEAAPAPFAGFGRDALDFFRGLERDNSRKYFEANGARYQADVRAPMQSLLHELSRAFAGRARLFPQEHARRFSRDTPPYKLKTYGVVVRADSAVARYVEISAEGLFAASGCYDMARDQLERYRAAVADDERGGKLERLLADSARLGLQVSGAQGSAPRGTRKDHPRLALLRRRSLLYGARLGSSEPALYERAALDFVVKTWRDGEPIDAWLDQQVRASSLPRERAFRGRRR